uniref:hypothetical protein n=1 Tax=Nonomuraea pusilla TaxID=46177 RepID=UPI000A881099|nr:hypothetical protein [Nonomuraea pusilla]
MTQTLPRPTSRARSAIPELQERAEKPRRERRRRVLRGAARGAVAAMAMSGMRQLTTALGLVAQVPPELVLKKTAPRTFRRVPVERGPALVETVHWAYGAAGGAVFALLPRAIRTRAWAGPLYGTLFWAGFETVLAPALDLPRHRNTTLERATLLVDHLLYGTVVGAALWPERDRR